MSGYETKDLLFAGAELKAAGDEWRFTGFGARYGNVDSYGDIILPGAFKDTLRENPEPPLFYQHDPGRVIGYASSLKGDHPKGLYGEYELFDTAQGSEAYRILKRRPSTYGLSIGYLTRDEDYDDDGHRLLKSVELVEISLVSLPANREAVVTGVKSAAVDYSKLNLEKIVEVLSEQRASALAAAKALVERRRSEGRKLSDRAMELLEALRTASQDDADALLALLTAPPPEREAKAQPEPAPADGAAPPPDPDPTPDPVAVRTADSLVEAHLRRARLKALRRKYADVRLPEIDPVAQLEKLPDLAWVDAAS